MYDIIIKNGNIIDGTGEPMYHSDIGIKDDKIARIGDLHGETAAAEIDAMGKFVCPGFIDVNNHSDTYWQIFRNPNLESLIYQGVTTVIGGNCGSSLAPLFSSRSIETIQKWTDLKQVNVSWSTMEEFLKVVADQRLSVNFGTLIGHATLRRGILKDEMRSLTLNELNFLKDKLREALKAGALGLSTGLIYTHARLASTEELISIAKVVQEEGGVYATHIRGEQEDLLSACEEVVEVAQKSGANTHISHLKAMGETNWKRMDEALNAVDHAKSVGVDITFDVYPYTTTGSVLYAYLPAWVSEGGKKLMLARLRNRETREKIMEEMRSNPFDWSKVEISISPLNKTLTRRKVTEIARSQDKSIEDAVIDILIACEGRVIATLDVLSDQNVQKAVCHPLSIISSNGAGYNIHHAVTGEVVHPRCFGTFPKIFEEYVNKREVLNWESAVKKMTGLPAGKFGIGSRGILKEGFFADVVIFDKDKIESPATKDNPYQYAKGIEYVFVNGKVILMEGSYTGQRAGCVIKR